jgi:glycosyltransferase involved in cell wall biosynthesis
VVFVDRPSLGRVDVPAGFEVVPIAVREAPCEAASSSGRRRVGDMLAVSRAIARSRLDVVYFPATYSFVPVWGVRRVVVTMHDTLPFRLPELVFPTRLGRLAWGIKEHAAVRMSDRIVTVSKASRRDLIEHFRLRPERVSVIVEGVDPTFRPMPEGVESDRTLSRYGIVPGSRFLLYVGGLSPHKNLLRLLDAFAQVEASDVRLVIVGDLADVFHTHVPELQERIARNGLHERVILAGFVPDAELAYLYSRAYALVQPSLLEGFGLPAAEAMACGTPVVHSRNGSLPEVVGDGGIGFDPMDTSAIRDALGQLLREPELRDNLGMRGLARSARFSWDASARGLLTVLEEVACGSEAKAGGRSEMAQYLHNR